MIDRTITECVNGKWLAQAPSGTLRYASQVMKSISRTPAARDLQLALPNDADEPPWAPHFPSVRSRCGGILFEQVAPPWISRRGRPVVVKRNPAYRELLSQAWQFDDVSSAVGMIRELSELQLRRRRIQDQFNCLDELRKHSPDNVIAPVYREDLKRQVWKG